MKKFLFWTALASVALTGCVKNDVEPNPSLGQETEITFNAPIVRKVTKAGPVTGPLGAGYSTSENFVVSAWSHTDVFTAATDINPYFNQVIANPTSATEDGNPYVTEDDGTLHYTWLLATKYYWPKTHRLTFSAFSPAELIDGTIIEGTSDKYADGATTTLEDGITLTNVNIPTDINKHYDILYSDRVYNQKERVYNFDVANNNYFGVDIPFIHALSSVNVKAKWAIDYNYGDPLGKNKIVITDIRFENVCFQASSFTENVGGNRALVNSANKNHATWNNPTNPQSISIESDPANELKLTTAEETFGIPALLIPQPLANTHGNVKLVVDYTITNASGNSLDESIKFDLSTVDFTTGGVTPYTWEIGKKYTYVLTFSLNEIHLAPYVQNWDDVDAEFDSDDLI